MVGQTVSHYTIIDKLGAGGMGEVYRAEDLRLHRQVAVKALPGVFAADPERLARFKREAKLLATLNHPNIAGIYGLEAAEGKSFLILELVESETLTERLARGPLPLDEALDICRQIAEDLAAVLRAEPDWEALPKDIPENLRAVLRRCIKAPWACAP